MTNKETKQNQKKRLRRSKVDNENANVNKGNGQQLKLNRAENAIMAEVNRIEGISENTRNMADGLQSQLRNLDSKMVGYDATDVKPRFETIEKKLDLLLNLVLQVDQEFDITDEEMKLLGLEEEVPEKAEEEEDSHAEE